MRRDSKMMRLTAYAGSSLALATGVLLKALNQRVNFFSACVYLSQSNACVIILVNLLVLAIGTLVFGIQRLLYGPLRPIEAEQLYDRAWFAVTETCLAMTMFREEIGVWFILLFISLLVGKAWAWIGEGRVEILEQQPPVNPRLFHARLSISLLLSLLFDVYLLDYSVSTVRHQARPTMMVMFAFEFAVLTAGSVSTGLRYFISLREAAVLRQQTEQRIREIRQERQTARQESGQPPSDVPVEEEIDETDIDVPGWEDKGRWVFYLELLTDLVRLSLYLTFFCVLCVFYGLPIYIIRDVAMAIRSFYKRITDFVRYKQATRDMNDRYPDASTDDVADSDVCIVCREIMRPYQRTDGPAGTQANDQRLRPKKLPCGHVLHFACLRSWLERQQSCPTCRHPVIESAQSVNRSANRPQQNPAQNRDNTAPGDGNGRPALPQTQPQGPAPAQRDVAPRPPAANGGWRRFELGPLRLDVGAWHHGQEPPAPPEVGQPAAQPNLNQAQRSSVPGGTQARPRALGSPATLEASTMQGQIDMIESQVLSQINSLRITVQQLARIRASQEELIRLHGLQHGGITPSVQVFRSDSTRQPLHAGSEGLPTGLVLPEGWSLLPMNRAAAGALAQNGASHHSQAASSLNHPSTRPTQRSQSTEAPRNVVSDEVLRNNVDNAGGPSERRQDAETDPTGNVPRQGTGGFAHSPGTGGS